MQKYYTIINNGFSFDGYTRLYNPFSILQCLKKGEFRNYWYESGSPSFIVEWMKEHQILDPNLVVVLEFKISKTSAGVEQMKRLGAQQIKERGYADVYSGDGREIITAVLVADAENREVR